MTYRQAETMRAEIERAMQQALATFPTNDRNRTPYLIAVLVALLDLDVTLVNRFLRHHAILCD